MQRAEQILIHFGNLYRRINDCKSQISELVAEKYSYMEGLLSAPGVEKVKAARSGDPVYSAVRRMVEIYDERIERMYKELSELCLAFDKIKKQIDAAELSDKEYGFLKLRYWEGLSILWIAEQLGYSERQTQRIRKSVLDSLDRGIKRTAALSHDAERGQRER